MADPPRIIHRLPRDGTSQRARSTGALDPASAPLDERSVSAYLRQVEFLANQLNWFDREGRPTGSWDQLLGDTNAAARALVVRNAARMSEASLDRLARLAHDADATLHGADTEHLQPHVALLLTVLRLLGIAQDKLNGLTRRHLDFLYKRVLQFQPRPHRADRVHAVLRPNRAARKVRVPAGTLLHAKADAAKRPVVYATDREIIVGKTHVAEVRSIRAQVERTTPSSIRRSLQTRTEPETDLLALALGDPAPGDPIPPAAPWGPAGDPLAPTRGLFSTILPRWLGFARDALHLDFFELRHLVQLKVQRDDDKDDWDLINAELNKIGHRRTGQAFDLAARLGANFDPRDFDRNLTEALGEKPDFSGVAEVETIDDLFLLSDREEVRDFLLTAPYNALAGRVRSDDLPFMDDGVVGMMTRKLQIEAEWQAINNYMEAAGRGKRDDPSFRLQDRQGFDPTAFDANFRHALPDLDFGQLPAIGSRAAPGDVVAYMAAIGEIEAYLHISAEQARFLLGEALPSLGQTSSAVLWHRADKILQGAREHKGITLRKRALNDALGAAGRIHENRARAVMLTALGRSTDLRPALTDLVGDLDRLLSDDANRQFLVSAVNTIDDGRGGRVDWVRMVDVCERAERSRLGARADRLEKLDWRGLSAYSDARSEVVAATTDDDQLPRWRTFGSVDGEKSASRLGWAFTSPILAMRQGSRKITLFLRFSVSDLSDDATAGIAALFAEDAKPPLRVRLSGAEDWIWIAAPVFTFKYPHDGVCTMQVEVVLGPEEPPVAAPAFTEEFSTVFASPLLMLEVQTPDAGQSHPYPLLQLLKVDQVRCTVSVGDAKQLTVESGLSDLALRNDRSLLDPAKPFELFADRPAIGARLVLTDPELATKRITHIALAMEWMGRPKNFEIYYKNYTTPPKTEDFKVRVSLVERGKHMELQTDSLFVGSSTEEVRRLSIEDVGTKLRNPPPGAPERRTPDPTDWSRYMTLELRNSDFRHTDYLKVVKKADTEVNEPWTPKLKSIALGYTAEALWDPAEGQGLDAGESVLYLHPFGHSPAGDQAVGPLDFLPDYSHEGELLIGLEGTQTPEKLSLLFQMAEGSANPELVPAPVSWSVLDGNAWQDLDAGEVRHDGTRGLINSGIVEIALPEAGTGSLLPADRYWLRLAVDGNPDSLCDAVDVLAQAVAATFVDHDNDPSHFDSPLPAETITRLARPFPGIAGVEQPFTSFGGRSRESTGAIRVRASERLRHRGRAVSLWDYERLALDRFPELYKAKCIEGGPEDAPGTVTVIVIPDISRQRPSDPFAPREAMGLLADIREYLQARAPLGARVQVSNATFVPIKVRVAIRFLDGTDIGLAVAELDASLKHFLSPWAYDDVADITIGGSIWANSIIDFLARRPGVDYVARPRLFRFDESSGAFVEIPATAEGEGGYHVTASAPDEVLVSAYQHDIDPIREDIEVETDLRGIGYMKIGLDFIVNAGKAA